MDLAIPCAVGVVLAVGVSILGRTVGFDRDRAFYSTILIVVASYYALYAVLGGSTKALILECLVISIFLAMAVLGFRGNSWIVALGLIGHGVMDLFHGYVIANPGVPRWWPWFCMAFDVAAGSFLACLLMRGRLAASRSGGPALP